MTLEPSLCPIVPFTRLALQSLGTVFDSSLAQKCNFYTDFFFHLIMLGHNNITYWAWKWQSNKQSKLKVAHYFVLPLLELK